MRLLNYQDEARLEYGRIVWKNPEMRARLLKHWTDSSHPYHERFIRYQNEVEKLLGLPIINYQQVDNALRKKNLSLRAVVREIPPVFGSLFE